MKQVAIIPPLTDILLMTPAACPRARDRDNNSRVIHLSDSPEQTQALAAAMAKTFRGGECVALHGDLGAGKTQFVRGLLRGLGGNPRTVSSPTFVLLNV